MDTKADRTKRLILECARQEFLAVGFHRASLREIAAAAQVTTGAIYRHFADKQALFSVATGEAMAALRTAYETMIHAALDDAEHGVSYKQHRSGANITELYTVIYAYFDQFYLLLMCSDGPDNCSLLRAFVEMEESSTLLYIEKMKKLHHSRYEIDPIALHFLIEAYVSALLEPIRHRMSRDDAIYHAQNLNRYFATGWLGLEEEIAQAK